jgi:phage terminase small subunit
VGEVKKKLTPLQERFCQEYIKDFDGTRAVKDSGYTTKYPGDYACQLLRKTQIIEELKKLSEKDRKKREGKKQRYIDELEKLALSDITKYEIDYVDTEYLEENRIKAKVKVTTEEEVDTLICSTAAIQEISQGKYGIKIKTHDKITPLLKLIEREDKLEAIEKEKKDSEDKPGSGFIEALQSRVTDTWADWRKEDEDPVPAV